MATESPMRIMPGGSLSNSHRSSGSASPSLDAQELRNLLLRERSRYEGMPNGNEVLMQRSESAPPSVEGSLASLGSVLGSAKGFPDSEEEILSHPAYLSYYYTHSHLNPRLPPPKISWENWRLAQRLQSGLAGASGQKEYWKLRSFDDNNSRSLFSSQPLTADEGEQAHAAGQEQVFLDNGPIGPMAHGFGSRGRSVVDLIQQDFPRTPSPVYSFGHESKEESAGPMSSVEMQLMHLQDMSALGSSSASGTQPQQAIPESTGRRSPFPPATLRSASAEPTIAAPQPINLDSLKRSGSSSAVDLSAALQGLSMAESTGYESALHQAQVQRDEREQQHQLRYRQRQHQRPRSQQATAAQAYELLEDQMQYALQNESASSAPVQPGSSNPNVFAAAISAAAMLASGGNPYQHLYGPQYNLGGYPSVPVMSGYSNASSYDHTAAVRARAAYERQQLYKLAGQQADAGGAASSTTLQDAIYLQYLQRAADEAAMRNYVSGTQADAADLAYLEHKLQYPRTASALKSNPLYYGRSPAAAGLPYYNSGLGSNLLHRESLAALRSGLVYGWQRDIGDDMNLRGSVLLEEFKSSKSRRFELSDIAGHVVEFSADQHGSRFIQQKLETASTEEKAMVFDEVLPHAFTLMTDVFGNYVIQKFFEHGNSQQRRELANLLVGHMLDLSLQMYGCRVIQKALEVCDVDQQTLLVSELDGHVMRCVRDQNGNHVIQKCIECVPPDKIQFIISAFYGQVLVLSTHPYGCRVIQRVLEHCTDDQKQAGIMEEILGATCSLAQDQYGNYVIQHVLEHGKPHERSEIITKLAGQIVQMSQHKFASNVVEKCLEFGGPAERQILVDEMLGTTDENVPLQAMMKDQFANYVVQKVLETCSDQQREILLGRIKVHLHALKKYTYGKHIVARVEKLVAAGERRGAALQSNNNSSSNGGSGS